MTVTKIAPLSTPGNGNGGIVPPWLQKPAPIPIAPPVIVLPVMPEGRTGDE